MRALFFPVRDHWLSPENAGTVDSIPAVKYLFEYERPEPDWLSVKRNGVLIAEFVNKRKLIGARLNVNGHLLEGALEQVGWFKSVWKVAYDGETPKWNSEGDYSEFNFTAKEGNETVNYVLRKFRHDDGYDFQIIRNGLLLLEHANSYRLNLLSPIDNDAGLRT